MLLTEQEIKELQKYRFSIERTPDTRFAVRVDQLLDEDELKNYLDLLQYKINAPQPAVAASILMKRFSFLAVMALYAMSVWDKRLNLQPENIWFVSDYQSEYWLPKFRFESLEYDLPDTDRIIWRTGTISILFSKHISPLIDMLHKCTKLSKLTLWENVAIYVFWLYETVMKDAAYHEFRNKLFKDFQFVTHDAPGELFGDYTDNPLRRFHSNKIYLTENEKHIRVRTTCCLYYKMEKDGTRCDSCPLKCNKFTHFKHH